MVKKKQEETKDLAVLETLKEANPELYAKILERSKKDMITLGYVPRLPSISISHGNPFFVFPNESTNKELTGVVVSIGKFKELYDKNKKEISAPICAAVNSDFGSKFGECAKCQYWQWGTGNPEKGVGRACTEARRILIMVEGHSTPFELKVTKKSATILAKAVEKAITAFAGLPTALLNFKATLSVMTSGTQSWSEIVPRFEMVEDLTQAKIEERLKLAEKYENYFTDVYGSMNQQGNGNEAVVQAHNDSVVNKEVKAEAVNTDDVIPF